MRKYLTAAIDLSFGFLMLTACGEWTAELSESQITPDADPKIVVDSPAIQMYDEFLNGERCVGGINIDKFVSD